jgi:hypothetical protein
MTPRNLLSAILLGGALVSLGDSTTTAFAASPLYWCPDRKGDRQYSADRGPGCVPLVEKKDQERAGRANDKPPREFKIENLQGEVTTFLHKYRQFLDCCKTDLDELEQVEHLGDEVGELLAFTQANLSNHSMASRGVMLRELIAPVAQARADLRTLRARLEKIGELAGRREQLNFEEAGRDAREMRALEESIERDIRAPRLPSSAKTGADIGVAPAAGPGIGKSPTTGADIGREGRTGQDIGASPKSGGMIGEAGRQDSASAQPEGRALRSGNRTSTVKPRPPWTPRSSLQPSVPASLIRQSARPSAHRRLAQPFKTRRWVLRSADLRSAPACKSTRATGSEENALLARQRPGTNPWRQRAASVPTSRPRPDSGRARSRSSRDKTASDRSHSARGSGHSTSPTPY